MTISWIILFVLSARQRLSKKVSYISLYLIETKHLVNVGVEKFCLQWKSLKWIDIGTQVVDDDTMVRLCRLVLVPSTFGHSLSKIYLLILNQVYCVVMKGCRNEGGGVAWVGNTGPGRVRDSYGWFGTSEGKSWKITLHWKKFSNLHIKHSVRIPLPLDEG